MVGFSTNKISIQYTQKHDKWKRRLDMNVFKDTKETVDSNKREK